jgi:hypothetical protein
MSGVMPRPTYCLAEQGVRAEGKRYFRARTKYCQALFDLEVSPNDAFGEWGEDAMELK